MEDVNTVFSQVAQLSQRDCVAGWVSFGQKWRPGTGRQYYADIIGSIFNHYDVIGQQSSIEFREKSKIRAIMLFSVIQGHS